MAQPIAARLFEASEYNESTGYVSSWHAAYDSSIFAFGNLSPDYDKREIIGVGFAGPIIETITATTLTVRFDKFGSVWGPIKCSLITGNLNSPTVIGTQTFTPSSVDRTHTFSFSGQVSGDAQFMFETVAGSDSRYQIEGSNISATITYGNIEALTIQINPSSFYSDDSALVTVGNSRSRSLSLSVTGNGYALDTRGTSPSASFRLYSEYYWFTQAHVDSGNLPIVVTISDDLGRSVNGSATMLRRLPSTFTPTSPKNTRVNGGQGIPFRWSYSGQSALLQSELQFSDDGTTWSESIYVENGETTYTVDAATLMPGTQYWQGRGYDDISGFSAWSGATEFEVYYTAVSQVVPSSSPTDGNISNYGQLSFSVALEPSEPVPFSFRIASASFFWRSGTSGAYTELAMTPAADGLTASVNIAAGTFPNGTMQWYAEATDTAGNTSQTDTYTLTVVNSAIVASPTSPINTIESGTGPIAFRWSYLTLDGSAQNGAELEYSTNGVVWVPFAGRSEITGDTTVYTAPAGTFPGGVVYWHVRPYTQDSTPGPWSQAVSFQCFAAPVVQAVSATAKPFSTITWQVEGQLAYEIEVDGKVFGPYFGANVRSFALPEPLDDGLHTVKVRAQNQYGLWSEWAENTVYTRNVPGPDVYISGGFIVLAILAISTADPWTYYIYRDGKLIGKTTEGYFEDVTAVGTHQYTVLNVNQTGYYTKSNTVEIDSPVDEPQIFQLAKNFPGISLHLSENANRSQTITREREVAYTQYAGAKFPEAEVGEHESLTVTGDVAFTEFQPDPDNPFLRDEAKFFESLLGKKVVYKTPGGECVVGILEGFQRRDPLFYKSYTFSIKQVDWEDFYDADSDLLF